MFIVYLIYYKNLPIYVGITCNPKQRFKRHKRDCFKDFGFIQPIHQYLKNLGITKNNFNELISFEILHENIPSKYEALKKEYFFHQSFKHYFPLQNSETYLPYI